MDNYKVIKVVGKGTFGRAILVKHRVTDKKYIVKQVKLHNLPEKEKKEARNEVKVLSSLQHENIVRYIKSFMDKGSLCIVMDFAEKGDLYQKIKKQRGKLFSESTIMNFFVQICSALEYVHKRHILHRDLKTQNIFIGSGDRVLLGDFGIARVMQSTMECARTMVGTPYYLSPELCREQPYNNKSDVWALGCVLYELCTLRHAFEANSMKGLIGKILRGKYPSISTRYSSDLRRIIDAMLQKDPRKRPSVEELLSNSYVKKYLKKVESEMNPTPTSESSDNSERQNGPIRGAPLNMAAIRAAKAKKEQDANQKRREERAREFIEIKRKQKEYEERRARKQEEMDQKQELLNKAKAIRLAEQKRAAKEEAKREEERRRAREAERRERARRKAEKEAYRKKKEAEYKRRKEMEYNRKMAELAAEQRAKMELQRKIRADHQRDMKQRQEEGLRRRAEAEARAEAERKKIFAENRRMALANKARLKEAMEGHQFPEPIQQNYISDQKYNDPPPQEKPTKKKQVTEIDYKNHAKNQFWEGKLSAAKNRYRNYLDMGKHDKANTEKQRILDIESQMRKNNPHYKSFFDNEKTVEVPSKPENVNIPVQKKPLDSPSIKKVTFSDHEEDERSYYKRKMEEEQKKNEALKREVEKLSNMPKQKQNVQGETPDTSDDEMEIGSNNVEETDGAPPKFKLGNQTLKMDNISESDSLCYRIESLRLYLETQLGDEQFYKAYQILNEQDANTDDAVIEKELLNVLGSKNIGFTSLIHQLLFCEDSFNESQ
mmetsp:Transcript_1219/g.1855  ORF Transcript_1219/g.1855 Transcript_1219/m.1855 type:complete len:776 (+) Transcript_1219:712-3039(+)